MNDKNDTYAFEYDGWTAFKDFSDKSEDELQHDIIDMFIHLASKTGVSVLEEVEGCLMGAKMSRMGFRPSDFGMGD